MADRSPNPEDRVDVGPAGAVRGQRARCESEWPRRLRPTATTTGAVLRQGNKPSLQLFQGSTSAVLEILVGEPIQPSRKSKGPRGGLAPFDRKPKGEWYAYD